MKNRVDLEGGKQLELEGDSVDPVSDRLGSDKYGGEFFGFCAELNIVCVKSDPVINMEHVLVVMSLCITSV